MMARARRQGRGTSIGGDRQRPLGVLLAVFALLCQSLVLLLPQPALALVPDAAPFDGGYVLCHSDQGDDGAPASPAKAPLHHGIDCALCQAFHATATLLPASPPIVPPPTATAIRLAGALTTSGHPHRIQGAHRARAPPSVLSL